MYGHITKIIISIASILRCIALGTQEIATKISFVKTVKHLFLTFSLTFDGIRRVGASEYRHPPRDMSSLHQ